MDLIIVRWYASQGSTILSHVIVGSMEAAKIEVKRLARLPWTHPRAEPYKPEVYPHGSSEGVGNERGVRAQESLRTDNRQRRQADDEVSTDDRQSPE